jgi:hypothetical protein
MFGNLESGVHTAFGSSVWDAEATPLNATIIAAMTNPTVTNNMMRLIVRYLLCPPRLA